MFKLKRFVIILVFIIVGLFYSQIIFSMEANNLSSILDVNYRELVSRADLTYEKPVARSEAGLPVGNGTMGSLVWTSPKQLKFQINRVDVYANNSASHSFNKCNRDYGYACGFVDIDFVDFGEDVFPKERTIQHLSVYDGLVTVDGKDITAEVLGWHERDVMAIRVTDNRDKPTPISAILRMLRLGIVQTKNHFAVSKLHIRDGRIILTQEFMEGDDYGFAGGAGSSTDQMTDFKKLEYYCSSAIAIGIVGRKAQAKMANETEVRLTAEAGKGSFTILIASAASFDIKKDLISSALKQLEAAAAKGFDELFEANKKWWHDFWAESFIHLHSADGVADYIEENYTYFLYVMASSSRGKYPPNFGGMIWSTGGDLRSYGVQQWWNNLSFYYNNALLVANKIELMDPTFNMYSGMYDACALAARQQWGSKGIYIPETTWFDGLAKLPEDIAAEMRDLYLLRKPWEKRSKRFREFAETKHPHSSRWEWITEGGRWIEGHWTVSEWPWLHHYPDEVEGRWIHGHWTAPDWGYGPFGYVNHMFSTTAHIANLYWLRYEYTLDKKWLREKAYPIIKGAVEFYRNYPNLQKEADGKYHIYYVNDFEAIWGGTDTGEDLSGMRGVTPLAIRASEILNVDAEMRSVWQEFLDNLAPLPTNDHPDAPVPRKANEPILWINGLNPAVKPEPRLSMIPINYYDLCTLETKDKDMLQIAKDTYKFSYPNERHSIAGGLKSGANSDGPVQVGSLSRISVIAAIMGRAEDVKFLLTKQIRPQREGRRGPLPNRMSLAEGFQAIGVERLGIVTEALVLSLCQGIPSGPGKETVIHVFPAWPKEWDAEYTLLARGGFLVTSSMQKGKIEFVEVKSQLGGECRLRNPWGEAEVTVYRNGKRWKDMKGSILKIETHEGEDFIFMRIGFSPEQFKRCILAKTQ